MTEVVKSWQVRLTSAVTYDEKTPGFCKATATLNLGQNIDLVSTGHGRGHERAVAMAIGELAKTLLDKHPPEFEK